MKGLRRSGITHVENTTSLHVGDEVVVKGTEFVSVIRQLRVQNGERLELLETGPVFVGSAGDQAGSLD